MPERAHKIERLARWCLTPYHATYSWKSTMACPTEEPLGGPMLKFRPHTRSYVERVTPSQVKRAITLGCGGGSRRIRITVRTVGM